MKDGVSRWWVTKLGVKDGVCEKNECDKVGLRKMVCNKAVCERWCAKDGV